MVIALDMKAKFNALIRISSLLSVSNSSVLNHRCLNPRSLCSALLNSAKTLTNRNNVRVEEDSAVVCQPKNSAEVFMKWGCTENDVSLIFMRRPSLRKANPYSLQSNLNLLSELGISSSDVIKIVNCRPRFLNSRTSQVLDERVDYLQELFGSREALCKTVVRNPSILTYDFHNRINSMVEVYQKLGVSKKDFISLLASRPTLISQTFFNDEKMEYIHKIGVKDSKMYKYVVCLIGVSRIETIQEKIANFKKFGFQEDEILGFFGRCPLLLTMSVEKIQRNMTFVLGTMKLPASMALRKPFLLYVSLDSVLKPRILLARKIQDMGLQPQIKGPLLMRALRMKEDRFVKVFMFCHPKDVAKELMDYYTRVKRVKKLAESSKLTLYKGCPF